MDNLTRIAIAQAKVSRSEDENLAEAKKMAAEAGASGVNIIVFPELFMAYFSTHDSAREMNSFSQELTGRFVNEMRAIAVDNNLWMVFGILEKAEDNKMVKYYNTIVIVDSSGAIAATYRKTHLYETGYYRESDYITAGDRLLPVLHTPFANIGIMVCYELRYPEIARSLTLDGADIIIVPSAWIIGPGKSDQLRTFIKARAMENTVFIAMCNSCGKKNAGESAVISANGTVLDEAGGEECLLITDIDLSEIEKIRKVMPSLSGRRPELY